MLGWRARIGCIRPAHSRLYGRGPESEMGRVVPEGVLLQHIFLDGPKSLMLEDLRCVYAQIEPAARELTQISPDVIIQFGTPICLVNGIEKIIELIEKATNVPATTCITSMVRALQRLDIGKVVVVTPYYPEEIAEMLQKFLEGVGFNVVSLVRGEGIELTRLAEVPQHQTYRLAKAAFLKAPPADGLLIMGAMPTSEIVEVLETDLGKPVVAHGFAAVWNVLNMANVRQPVRGYGRLLTMF